MTGCSGIYGNYTHDRLGQGGGAGAVERGNMTPNELYKIPGDEPPDKYLLNHDNLPEVWPVYYEPEVLDKADWIKIINHGYHQFDYRRYWQLASVWFMDKPVMIIQEAGREGDDHRKRFITDVPLFWQMAGYLQALRVFKNEPPKDAIDPDRDDPKLTEFYGNELREFVPDHYLKKD